MKKSLPLLTCAAVLLAGCGGGDEQPLAVVSPRVESNPAPQAATAAGALAQIPESETAKRRLGYVNTEQLASLTAGKLGGDEIQRLVLTPAGAAQVREAVDPPTTAVQVGGATVLGPNREIVGGSAALRKQLAPTTFDTTAITKEERSAVESCLGDGAAQVILGPGTAGKYAAIGAGLIESQDAPAGVQLRVCAAPHWVREVHALEGRFAKLFPKTGDPATDPVIAETEIGEREMIGATVLASQVDESLLRDYLAGGPKLVDLATGN